MDVVARMFARGREIMPIENDYEPYIGPFCPCCGTGAGALEILADVLDALDQSIKRTDHRAQEDLRKWAHNIRGE